MVDRHPGFTPGGNLTPAMSELLGTKTGRLPKSGAPMQNLRLERSRDYPYDSNLCWERGQHTLGPDGLVCLGHAERIRLTGADLHALRALLTAQDDLKELRGRAREAGLSGNGHGTDLAAKIEALVLTAHGAGYMLCASDHAATNQDAAQVAEFLQDLLPGHDNLDDADRAALVYVIELLQRSR